MQKLSRIIILRLRINVIFKDEGVTFNIHGVAHNFRGTLTLVSADNPASHLLGGYKSLTSALRKCRFCMATDISSSVSLLDI